MNAHPTQARKKPAALAVAAHPDDIEFLMAGTLVLLRQAGWETHYFNLCSGNCGSARHGAAQTRRIRRGEARAAARILGAHFHPSLVDDLELFYEDRVIRRVAAVIRDARPRVLLTHSPQDYMEDHVYASRVAVTAAFARGMRNYRTQPARPAVEGEVTVYHAMPHGLRDGLRRLVTPGAFVNTDSVQAVKRQALAAHVSQGAWLDVSQGMGSYLQAMEDLALAVGKMSGQFARAEGWRRHSHLGFCGEDADPLRETLGQKYLVNEDYERGLG